MSLTAVEQWSTTAASNTTLGASITLDGTVMTPSQVDDGFRELMAQVAAFNTAATFGNSSQLAIGGTTGRLTVVGDTNATSGLAIAAFNATAGTAGHLDFYRSKNATKGSATVVASGDNLGALNWYGAQQTGTFATQTMAAQIRALVDGTATSGASGDMPGSLVFATTADGGSAVTDRLILDSAGVLKPNANDGVALGTGALSYADLFLASGGVVNWNNGDVTLTHAANQLTFGGASSGYLFDAVTAPASNDGAPLGSTTNKWSDLFLASGAVINFNSGDVTFTHASGTLIFTGTVTSNASSNTPGSGNNLSGVALDSSGTVYASRGGQALIINRTSDGTVMQVNSGGTTQGSVSISGATVTWGTFTGAHWSQLANGAAKIDILRGTILETIDEMCDWFALSYVDHAGTPWLHEQGVPEGAKEGDSHVIAYDYEDEGETKRFTTTATVVRLRNDNLARFKVSDEAGSNAVYGVFGSYDPDFPNDVNIHAIGTDVIRLPAGVTPKRGDLIESKGDGCGRIQADNLFRASTVAKISAPIVVGEHPDGSRLFPCTLHCG